MSTSFTMPAGAELGQKLGDLIGKEIAVGRGQRIPIGPRSRGAMGVFAAEDGEASALVYFDLPAACSTGAAIALLPAASAEEGEKRGQVPEDLFENLTEVFNVAHSWFENGPPLKLVGSLSLPAPMSRPVMLLLLRQTNRLDLTIEIPDYSQGQLSIFVKW